MSEKNEFRRWAPLAVVLAGVACAAIAAARLSYLLEDPPSISEADLVLSLIGLVYLAINLMAAIAASMAVRRILRSHLDIRKHPQAPFVILILVVVWCGLALWDWPGVWKLWRRANHSLPSLPPDYGSALMLLFARFPSWMGAMAPAFPTLFAVLQALFPRLRWASRSTQSLNDARSPTSDWTLTQAIGTAILFGAVAIRMYGVFRDVLPH
jgi:hypothetical protein